MRILVIDDIATHRLLIEQIVHQHIPDAVVDVAEDGYKGLNKLTEMTDIVITDIGMPGMSGFDFARQVKWMKQFRDIPILFTTADYKQEEFVNEGYAIGAVDYIVKPVEPNALINKLKLHYKLASAHKELKLLNEDLEKRVEEKIAELAEKNKLLLQQSKLVSLGNMFSILLEQLEKPIDNMIHLSTSMHFDGQSHGQGGVQPFCFTELQELSQIVADFRKLVNDNKLREAVSIREKVEQAVRATRSDLSYNNVKVYVDGDYDTKIIGNTHDFVMPMSYLLSSLSKVQRPDKEGRKDLEITIEDLGHEVLIRIQGICVNLLPDVTLENFLTPLVHVSLTIFDEVLCARFEYGPKGQLAITIPSIIKSMGDASTT